MATVNLGRIKPVFGGAYNNSTAYVVDDIVTQSDETFICILASTGNATSNATYWTKLAAKGTDGTDVGATLTTEGDILYRDGSGLQRLAKPASDMYLKNTSAGAVSWSAVSSDYVKVAETTLGSNAASMVIDNCFTSDYDIYDIEILKYKSTGSSTASQLRAVFRNGGASGTDDSQSFKNLLRYEYAAYNSTSVSGTGSAVTSSNMQFLNGWHQPSNSYNQVSMRLHHVNGELPMLTGLTQGRQGGTSDTHYIQTNGIMGSGTINKGTTSTGIKLYAHSSNIVAGCTLKIYGIK